MDAARIMIVFVGAAALGWALASWCAAAPAEPEPLTHTEPSRGAQARPAPAPAPPPHIARERGERLHSFTGELAPEPTEDENTHARKPTPAEYAQTCEQSETCADGRACVDGGCAHCLSDAECEGELICARDRCMVPDDVACTRDDDCGPGSYCVDDVRAHGPARARHFTVCTHENQGDALFSAPA